MFIIELLVSGELDCILKSVPNIVLPQFLCKYSRHIQRGGHTGADPEHTGRIIHPIWYLGTPWYSPGSAEE